MGLFDLFSNFNRKLDAIISYDAKRNSGKVLITSNITTQLSTLEIIISKINDYDDWVSDFIFSIEYTSEDDEGGTEYKDINLELSPGIPNTIDFSLETFKSITRENIQKYYEEVIKDGSFEKEEVEEFLKAFLDPKWKIQVSVDDIVLGENEFEFDDEGIREYITSLKA